MSKKVESKEAKDREDRLKRYANLLKKGLLPKPKQQTIKKRS